MREPFDHRDMDAEDSYDERDRRARAARARGFDPTPLDQTFLRVYTCERCGHEAVDEPPVAERCAACRSDRIARRRTNLDAWRRRYPPLGGMP